MIKGTVTRNDNYWQGHPDVAFFKDYFYVVFRQAGKHKANDDTQIMLTRSKTGFKYSEPVCIATSKNRFNCPRLSVIDDSLWILCDVVIRSDDFISSENEEENTKILLWTSNNGKQWSNPIDVGITGIVPDRICQTDDKGFLIATHTLKDDGFSKYLVQNVWKTTQKIYLPQWIKYSLADEPQFNLCEASICNYKGQLICLMRENSQQGNPCLWTTSKDHGKTWTKPIKTKLFGGHRPVLGKLKSGNFLTTYREQCHSHVPGFWAKNTIACLTMTNSMIFGDMNKSINLPLDHDNATKSDGGYTGWVETEDNQIYIVNYVTKDAPKAYIVWYLIDEKEF